MSGQEQRHRRRRSRRRRRTWDAEEGRPEVGRVDWPRFMLMIANGLVLLAFLLLIVLAPLPLGANREWAWAPILVGLGGLSLLVALGLGNPRGFSVEPEERWPLLMLLLCFLAFTFVGLLQVSNYAPPVGSAEFYARARALLGQAHDVVPTLSVDQTRNALLRGLACVLIFVLARALFREPGRARWLLYAFLLSAVMVMAYALAAQISTGGCYVGTLLKKQGDYTNDRCLMSGTFANSNSFGCFAGMALAAAVALVLQERRRRRALEAEDDDSNPADQFLRKMAGGTPIYLALALLFLGAQLFSSSRAAFAATVTMMAVLLFLSMRGRWRSGAHIRRTMIAGGAIGLVVLLIAGGAMLRKVSLLSEVGNFNRTIIWQSSIRAAQGSPWLGWGLGTYTNIYAAYQPAEIRQANDKAHSTPIELFVEAGWLGLVPGVLLVVVPWGICLLGAWRRRRHRYLMVAAVAVPGIAIVHSCVDFSLQIPAIAYVSAAFLGMGWAQTFYRTPPATAVFTEAEE
ncbi:MAG: O-antigen ligase family protein [Proteobacteria bacterium]|nr:O-antigen ligase family protein [Pseudomonadota bacterium]